MREACPKFLECELEKVLLKISKNSRESKPNLIEEWHDLSDIQQSEWTVEELACAVGEMGNSFSHATFDGDIRYDNFLSAQLMVVDIDDKEQVFHPRRALERLRECGLGCNIIYRTFSDPTPNDTPPDKMLDHVRRYRMIFVLDEPILDVAEFKDYLENGMYRIFPEADRCHATQIWAGGKGVVWLDESYRLTPMHLMNAAHSFEVQHIKSIQKKSAKFKKLLGAAPQRLLQGAVSEGFGSNTTNCNNDILHLEKNEPLRHFDWGRARAQFKLLDDFLECRRKIWHSELRGLYSGMRRIEGGKKLWREAIEDNPLIDDEKIITIGKWIEDYVSAGHTYWEEKIADYAPGDPAAAKYERLTDLHFSRTREAMKVKDFYHIPLRDAEWALRYAFNDIKEEMGTGTYILKCATGIGKTQLLMGANLAECVIAVPTHRLKDEISQRLAAAGVKHIVIPELPLLPPKIQAIYDAYLRIGAYNYAAGFLRSLKMGRLEKYGVHPKDEMRVLQPIMKFFKDIDRAVESTLPVVTTHKRIMHTEFPNHSCLIVDEDILDTVGEVKSIPMAGIRRAMSFLKEDSQWYGILDNLHQRSKQPDWVGRVFPFADLRDYAPLDTDSFSKAEVRGLVESGINGDIISMMRSEKLIIVPKDHRDPEGEKVVHFIVRTNLPQGVKKIILSATASEFMYRELFPDAEFHDLSLVETQGIGVQYSNRSFSRSTILAEGSQKELEKVATHLGDRPTITYMGKRFQVNFRNPFQHLENIEGTDELKGKNIAVVGTPNKPYFLYLLWASMLGIDYAPDEVGMSERLVEHNGYQFGYCHLSPKVYQ
jgi:hypothetical protein